MQNAAWHAYVKVTFGLCGSVVDMNAKVVCGKQKWYKK